MIEDKLRRVDTGLGTLLRIYEHQLQPALQGLGLIIQCLDRNVVMEG